MSLLNDLNEKLIDAFKKAGFEVEGDIVQLSDRPDLSEFQCNTALNKAKELKTNPRQIAESVVEVLKIDNTFSDVSIAGPGFINLTLNKEFLSKHVEDNFNKFDTTTYIKDKKKIIVDYGGANVAKPLHVGHLRPAIIGEGIKRLAKALGNDVLGDVHLGDWGRQMGIVISEIKRRMPDLPYFDENYEGEYPEGCPVTVDDLNEIYPEATAKAKEDEDLMDEAREITSVLQHEEKSGHRGIYALWRKLVDISIEDLKKNYDHLNVHFELWRGESDCNKSIPEMTKYLEDKGLLSESEGAIIMDVSEDDDKSEIPPVIIRTKSDSVGYQTTDLATLYERVKEFNPDSVWYVVDSRQSLHFVQVFRAAYKSGIFDKDKELTHVGFGTINGEDGKPFKTRDGGVMKLEDLLNLTVEKSYEKITNPNLTEEEKKNISEITADASIKYADAVANRMTDYVFDVDKFTDNTGKTGPYILYSEVRIRSLLAKAKEQGLIESNLISENMTEEEHSLMLQIERMPDVLVEGYKNKSLSEIANYLYDLNSAFNNLYNNYRILDEENKEKQGSLLKLIRIVSDINEKLLDIMAINIPEKM